MSNDQNNYPPLHAPQTLIAIRDPILENTILNFQNSMTRIQDKFGALIMGI
jgi:hypothetical protein